VLMEVHPLMLATVAKAVQSRHLPVIYSAR
jgi:hypothetical protein